MTRQSVAETGRRTNRSSTMPDRTVTQRRTGSPSAIRASGTISFDVGSAPYVVDVFATAGEQIPAQVDLWGERVERVTGNSPAPHTVPIPTAARHVLVLFQQAARSPTCDGGLPYRAMLGELAFVAG